jgi:hypothetical protein
MLNFHIILSYSKEILGDLITFLKITPILSLKKKAGEEILS